MRIKLAFVTLVFIFTNFTYADVLDIDTCISEALTKSELVKSSKEAVNAASSDAKGTFMNFLPTAKISYNYMKLEYYNEPEPMSIPITDPPINIEFPLPEWQNNVEVSITQPITPLWSVYKGYSAKNLAAEIQRLQLTLTENQLKSKIREYYNTYFMLEESAELIDETNGYLMKYKEMADMMIEEGITDKRATLKIDIELARTAKEKQNIKGNQSIIKTAIALMVDRDEDSFTLEKPSKKSTEFNKSYKELLNLQEDLRPEMKMLKKSDVIADNIYDTNIQPFIPTLALVAGYKNDFEASMLSPEGTFYVGGALEWNIGFDWIKNGYGLSKAKSENIKTKLENIDSRKNMYLQIKSLYTDLLVKKSTINLSEKEVIEAEENLRIEDSKYKEKMTTETDLLNALVSLKQAKTSLISSYYDYCNSLNSLAGVLGTDIEELINN